MSSFEVVHRGAVGGVQRRRRIVPLTIAAVLLLAGVVATVLGIVRVVGPQGQSLDALVGRAPLPGGTVTFTSEAGPYTIFLLTPGIENSIEVERQVGAAVCEVAHPSGARSTIRGGRQGTSVTTDAASTIGWFTAESGTTTVTCVYDRAVPEGREFAVGPGKPSTSFEDLALLIGGSVVLVAGGLLLGWAWRPRVVSTVPRP
jgi:hypothetical protein